MKVILTADVYKHGVAGEVVRVADGYARNYLIPQGLAVKATPGALKQSEKLRETAAARRAALENQLNELARQIDGVTLVFGRRAGANGKLYGSVTSSDIQQALLEKTGVDLNRRRIAQQSIRELGEFEVPVRLGSEFTPKLNVIVVREEELASYLAPAAEAAAPAEEEAAPELASEKIVELIKEAEARTATLGETGTAE
ncbi:MAG: 50S ribosomal protein L9 [Anaerolineae bacterium]|nr:50S ribosomal protein L9 [Anaerolineae bacterium]